MIIQFHQIQYLFTRVLKNIGFIHAAKEASSAATELLITARSFKFKEPADRLKEATVGVISSAKILFKNKDDEICIEQLETAMGKVAQVIFVILNNLEFISIFNYLIW